MGTNMIRGTLAALLVATAIPCVAQAQNFEVIAIGNGDENSSNYYMLSLRSGLSFGQAATEEGTVRNAQVGLRLRVDVAKTTYDTNYDGTPGTGTGMTYRLLLAYGIPLDADTTLTFTGGASHRTVEVRPTTLNSPADTEETGPFASVDFEYSPENFGSLQLLAEHDGVGATYGSVTYLAQIGQNVRIGPTANYVSEG